MSVISRRRAAVFGAAAALAVAAGPAVGSAAADRRSDGPVVSTQSGAVRGVTEGRAEQFLGLPYAAPPLRELRFAPPAARRSGGACVRRIASRRRVCRSSPRVCARSRRSARTACTSMSTGRVTRAGATSCR